MTLTLTLFLRCRQPQVLRSGIVRRDCILLALHIFRTTRILPRTVFPQSIRAIITGIIRTIHTIRTTVVLLGMVQMGNMTITQI